MEITTNKQYKTLGNAIRESVFRAKEAPTMLPDETIEKLGLGEDDILVIKDIEELDEAKKRKLNQKQIMKVLDHLDDMKYSNEKDDLWQLTKSLKAIDGKVNFNVAKTIKVLTSAVNALKQLEKDSDKEFRRLDVLLDDDTSASNSVAFKGSY